MSMIFFVEVACFSSTMFDHFPVDKFNITKLIEIVYFQPFVFQINYVSSPQIESVYKSHYNECQPFRPSNRFHISASFI